MQATERRPAKVGGPKHVAILADRGPGIRVVTGGYGSLKTTLGAAWCWDFGTRALAAGHKPVILATEPTYRMVADVMEPAIMEFCDRWGIPFTFRKSDHEFTLGPRGARFTIKCRSLDRPRSCEGINADGWWGDEWELCKRSALIPAERRVRRGKLLEKFLTGTAEGFNEAWALFLKTPSPTTRQYLVSSEDNPWLAEGYIEQARRMFDPAEFEEKIHGLRQQKGGRVYTRFDRAVHLGTPCVDRKRPGVALELWCDFNIGAHCWLLVEVDHATGCAHVVREVIGYETDTAEHAQTALGAIADHLTATTGRRYTREDVRDLHIEAPCDASARNRGALASHAAILREAGFRPRYSSRGNPAVEDRVVSVQMRLADRKLTVDPQRAPRLAEALEQQGRDPSGSPAKHPDPRRDHSGPADALGYGVWWHWPAFRLRANGESERRAQAERDARDRDAQRDAERWRGVIT